MTAFTARPYTGYLTISIALALPALQ